MAARTRLTVTLYVPCLSGAGLVSVGPLSWCGSCWGCRTCCGLNRNVWHWGDANRSTTRKTSLVASLLIANPTRTVLWPHHGTPVGDQPPERWHCVSSKAALIQVRQIYSCNLKGYGGLGGEAAVILACSRSCRVS